MHDHSSKPTNNYLINTRDNNILLALKVNLVHSSPWKSHQPVEEAIENYTF